MLLGPTIPEPHLTTARCLAALGHHVEARREFRLAFTFGATAALSIAARLYPRPEDLYAVAPDTAEGLLELAAVLYRSNRFPEAISVYQRVLEEYSDDRALMPLVVTYSATNQLELALQYARVRTAHVPGDEEAWRASAEVLLNLGREDEATGEARRGLAGLPGSPSLLYFLTERAFAHKRYSEAKLLAEQMAARSMDELASKKQLIARALASQGRLGEAIEVARSVASAADDAPWALLLLAKYLEEGGHVNEAIPLLERVASMPGQDRAFITAKIAALRLAGSEERAPTLP
jgi:tetratricopeptide (TPR) repeat protein